MTTAAIVRPDHKLTSQDVKLLRTCKTIVFHFRHGQSYINCIVDYDNREKDVQIDCDTRISNYVGYGDNKRNLGDVIGASHVISHAIDWDVSWRTTAEFLREGDTLEAHWMACNNNQYLDKNGLYQDELHLIVTREDKRSQNGFRRMVFQVDVSICENNTAKMIKHTSTPKSVLGGY